MSWEEFNSFNESALIEYLDLLAEDIKSKEPQSILLVDGGICNPSLLAQALPSNQIVCLSRLNISSSEIWEENEERQSMKMFIDKLEKPEEAWSKFLEFDTKITQTILKESEESKITICEWSPKESQTELSDNIAKKLDLENIAITKNESISL